MRGFSRWPSGIRRTQLRRKKREESIKEWWEPVLYLRKNKARMTSTPTICSISSLIATILWTCTQACEWSQPTQCSKKSNSLICRMIAELIIYKLLKFAAQPASILSSSPAPIASECSLTARSDCVLRLIVVAVVLALTLLQSLWSRTDIALFLSHGALFTPSDLATSHGTPATFPTSSQSAS